MLRVEAEKLPGRTTVLRAIGELDQDWAPVLQTTVAAALDSGATTVAIDCRGLEFVDSTGLTTLLRADAQAIANGAALHLARIRPELRTCLALTGLDQVLTLHPDLPASTPPEPTGAPTLAPAAMLAELTRLHQVRREARRIALAAARPNATSTVPLAAD